jgi:Ca2+-binding RTX toxin-like protein
MTYDQIRQVYHVYFSAKAFLQHPEYGKQIEAYQSAQFSKATLTYAARDIRLPDNSIYKMPAFTFVGYTPDQFRDIETLMTAIQKKLENEPGFATLPGMRSIEQRGEESLYSMLAHTTLPGNARGITAPLSWDLDPEDHQVEILVNSAGASHLEFQMRIFHEFLHEEDRGAHRWYDPSKTDLENLAIPLTVAEMRRVDLPYGQTNDIFGDMAAELHTTLSQVTQTTDNILGGLLSDPKADIADNRRDALINRMLARFHSGDVNTAELNELVRRHRLKRNPMPPGLTPEQQEAFLGNLNNYTDPQAPIDPVRVSVRRIQAQLEDVQANDYPTLAEAVNAALAYARNVLSNYAPDIGQIFGSTLGRQLFRNGSESAQILGSTALGVVGLNLGQEIQNHLNGNTPGYKPTEAFGDIDADIKAAGTGAISSYLTAELFDSLGLEGTLAELGQSVFAAELSAVITALSSSELTVIQALRAVNIGTLVGGYIGTKLASEVVEFDTVSGQIGASIGTAIGAVVGAKIGLEIGEDIGVAWGGPLGAAIGAAIGAFIGYIVGGIIGTFFATTPKSGASLVFDERQQRFAVQNVWAKGGAPKDGARAFATNGAELLNAILQLSGARVENGSQIRLGEYGTQSKSFVYRTTDASGKDITAIRTKEANLVLNYGAAYALADLLPRLLGGDLYTKRALVATMALAQLDIDNMPTQQEWLVGRLAGPGNAAALDLARRFDMNVVLGNIAIAKDYAGYLSNRKAIDLMIAADPTSAFAAGWVITLARAHELGLDRRARTDWAGGWALFLDETFDGRVDGVATSPANVGFVLGSDSHERLIGFADASGTVTQILGDTIETAVKDVITATTGADTIVVSGATIANTASLTINGAAGTGAAHVIDVAALIDGGAGNDVIVAGDLGNDVLGGDGNDTLVGGKLDDWLFGGDGNDRLFAGAANFQFTEGDANAMAAAINVISNGDMLDGGAGDDVLYGSRGSDYLIGGDGADLLIGGAGGDILAGGAGNDQGANGAPALLGGIGGDQYVFNFGDGIDVIFDASGSAPTPGATGNSLYERLQGIQSGAIQRDWAAAGDYEVDGNVVGGADSICFGTGITMRNLILKRSGTALAPGSDLIIQLTVEDPITHARVPTGDQLTVKDWFEPTRRVEAFRFADGSVIRLGDISSTLVGTSESDIIIGTSAADFIVGGAGNDTIRGLGGDDFGFGDSGDDLVAGDEDNDFVLGGTGNDQVIGGSGADTAFGDDGNDYVYGGNGSDIVVGGQGDDEVVGGSGDDIFKYQRGDGRDTLMDEYVNNWDLVWQGGGYTNGYVLNPTTGTVSKNGAIAFDGTHWVGVYDYNDSTSTLRRHLGADNTGSLSQNAGNDTLEFTVGINIQDLMLRQNGADLEIAIGTNENDARSFDAVTDRITLRDWYTTGPTIENFVFAGTGRHVISTFGSLGGGTEAADTLIGTSGVDWITGNSGDDDISGGHGDDILSGNAGQDKLKGDAGNDVLYGGDANDVLEGGAGADLLLGGTGMDIASYAGSSSPGMRASLGAQQTNTHDGAGDIYTAVEGIEGTTGDDILVGDADSNVLRGIAGNDALYGGAGDDAYEIDLSQGQDVIFDGTYATEEIVDANGELNTALYVATWTDLGYGPSAEGDRYRYRVVLTRRNTGEEVYRSRDGIDLVYTSARTQMSSPLVWPAADGQWSNGASRTGNGVQVAREVLQSVEDGGQDLLDFGAGIGLSDLTFTRLNGGADLQVTYQSGNSVTLKGQSDASRAIETLQLNDGLTIDLTSLRVLGESATTQADFMVGSSGADTLEGLGGDDILSGLAGNDTLRGGDGNDAIEGGLGNDTIDGGTDSITQGLPVPAEDATQAYGDTVRYTRSNAAVTVNLETGQTLGGHAQGDSIVRVGGVSTIENIVGSLQFNDRLTGDSRANRLFGLGGNDIIDGRAGDDVIVGGQDHDNLRGGDGNDNISGDDGDDTIRGDNGNDVLGGGAGVDNISGDSGDDMLSGADDNDTLDGGVGKDILSGDSGNDTLTGGDDDDQIAGGDGDDLLYGGAGNDALVGGAGVDWLAGEAGDDTYVFDAAAGTDAIFDTDGRNRIAITDATLDQIWLARDGNDLLVSVIGGDTTIRLMGYFTPDGARVNEVAVETHSLFLGAAGPLIDAMTQYSASTPAVMPSSVAATLASYWLEGHTSPPVVTDQTLDTNEDTSLAGAVNATDANQNIVSYTLQSTPTSGSVTLNSTTGTWVFTPIANVHGQDAFQILVTDADGLTALQNITVNVASVNDAPSDIVLTPTVSGITERDHPPTGTLLDPVVLGTISVVDVDAPDDGDFATHVFTVSDSRFEIVNGTTLRLKAGAALDFEAGSTVSFDVTVRDRNGAPEGLTFTKTFTFNVLDQDDYFYGTAGNDTLTGQAGRNLLYGFGGNDVLTGGNAVDTLDGGDGADQLFGLGGNDVLEGFLGDDALEGGSGNDTIHGGDGTDALFGQGDNDQLFGDGGADQLQGGDGADLLDGGADNDRLEGGIGNDTLTAGSGNDLLIGGAGADHLLGGDGVDTFSYETATAGVTVNLATGAGSAGDAAGDVFDDAPEILIGSGFADTLTGSAGADTIDGGAGNDTIYGGTGNDILRGGDGNDTLDAQAGDDVLEGGAGNDILIGGDDSDTYLMDLSSGADEIHNFDPNGTDIDVVGYRDITNDRLWFARSGNDLVVTVVGTTVTTTVKDWYVIAGPNDRSNYKIDFFLAGIHVTQTIDAEGLVDLMAGYSAPTTQAAFNALHTDAVFEEAWRSKWRVNAPPSVTDVPTQTLNEDGTLTVVIRVTDDFTPNAGVVVVSQAVRTDNYNVEDLSIVNAPTVGPSNAQGDHTLTVTTKPNATGQVAIKVVAVDAGGVVTQKIFLLTIVAVADTPVVTQAISLPAPAPATRPTLAFGSLALDIQGALVDNDGSETLTIRLANVPSQLSFNTGTNLGGGVWSFTPAQLSGLRIQGPANWSQNVQMSVTATSTESSNGNTSAPSAARPLNIDFNAAPTDIQTSGLSLYENSASGTAVGTFTRTDADAAESGGDAPTYSLTNNAGGLFSVSAGGTLTSNAIFNRETAGSYGITVRVTDSGGLSYDKAFTVTINDVNEAPGLNSSYSFSVAESATSGAIAGTIAASDPDVNTPAFRDFRYELIGAPSKFGINATTGQILVQGGLYDGASSYNFGVRVWDGGAIGTGNSASSSVSIAVQDVDRAPTINNPTVSVAENAGGPGVPIATITGSDPDGTLAYQLLGGGPTDLGNPMAFTIDASGHLMAQTTFDYETRTSYNVGVRTWDGGAVGAGHAYDTTVHVNITNSNDAPTLAFTPKPNGPMSTYVGHAIATDIDGDPVTYELVSASQLFYTTTNYGQSYYSSAEISGAYITSSGDLYCPTDFSTWYELQYPFEYWTTGMQYTLVIRAKDSNNQSSNGITVTFSGTSATVSPIVLDLDNDGLELVSVRNSQVTYAMSDDVTTLRTGWVGADDALLALDRNGDGTISGRSEISFIGDVPNATSDLEGLAAFDTNHDGYFNAGDARFSEFRVWQDRNQDGVSQADELRSLSDAGVKAIGLTLTPTGASVAGATDNVITATADLVRSDGSVGVVGDVTLAYLEKHVEVVSSSDDTPIDEVDRGATRKFRFNGAGVAPPSSDVPQAPAPDVAELDPLRDGGGRNPLAQYEAPPAADARRDFDSRRARSMIEAWEYQGPARRDALTAPLDSVARRRLQMVDAMATFSAEGAPALELQPHRHVDARTLELLTAVAGLKSAA